MAKPGIVAPRSAHPAAVFSLESNPVEKCTRSWASVLQCQHNALYGK